MEKEKRSSCMLQRPEGALLGNSVITSHLVQLGYPQKSIDSLLRCGESTKFKFIRTCGCGNKIVQAKHHCSLRTCSDCAKIRKRKVSRKYFSYMSGLHKDRKNFLYFLTISPKNYRSLSHGLQHIKDSWSKFIRTKYIKDRFKGGLYVIETKGGDGNWNIHMHAIIYGRWIDNKIRKHKDSRIVRLFKESSGRSVNMHVTRQNSVRFTLNYMCKYIASNKDDFHSTFDMAKYITVTRRRRLIHTFGSFYRKMVKSPLICHKCECRVEYIIDVEAVEVIEDFELAEKPPPDLYYYI